MIKLKTHTNKTVFINPDNILGIYPDQQIYFVDVLRINGEKTRIRLKNGFDYFVMETIPQIHKKIKIRNLFNVIKMTKF